MSEITRQQIEAILATYQEPHLATDLLTAKAVKNIVIKDQQVVLDVELGFPVRSYRNTLCAALEDLFLKSLQLEDVTVNVEWDIKSHSVQHGITPLPQVKNIIAVASGKGGVGKSTVAVNLALALQDEGAQAAILDADIYGPSIPTMLGCKGKPQSPDGKTMNPLVSYYVQCISIGHIVTDDTAMIWRGPMATSALQQLLTDTNWLNVDYLIVDLPPGTGDIQLTLAQRIPVSGAVIVTTPQDISLIDARRALAMFEKVQVPVLGIVENMSVHVCSKCGNEEHIFGEGGGQSMADQYNISLLGSLPLEKKIREGVDHGRPTVAVDPHSHTAESYRNIARSIAARLSLRVKDYSAKFPKIVVQNT